MPDEKRERFEFSLGQPFLEPVPGAIVFEVDARERTRAVFAHLAYAEFPGAQAGMIERHVEARLTWFRLELREPPTIFVVHRLILGACDTTKPGAFASLAANRFRFTIGTKRYAVGPWELAACGVAFRHGLAIPTEQPFYLEAEIVEPLPDLVRFYLMGEWGREVA